MRTGQEIIQEALEYSYNEKRRDNMSPLERLLDFSTFGRLYERKAQSASIMFLTDRLMEETSLRSKAEQRADAVYLAGLKAVEIYGPEAVEVYKKQFRTTVPY